ncbi:hypothetical protein O3G_MSEX000470, partial [Manduca sexta]
PAVARRSPSNPGGSTSGRKARLPQHNRSVAPREGWAVVITYFLRETKKKRYVAIYNFDSSGLRSLCSTDSASSDYGQRRWCVKSSVNFKYCYTASKIRSKETGQCDKHDRGDVIYKDNTEIVLNKNFAQGFFFLVINQIGQFTCLIVNMETSSRTNAAMWVEHYCHRDLTGLAHGVNEPLHRGDGYKKIECFMYFKSAAFIEFRFLFSFKAILEVTLYGREEIPREIPNPWVTDITTLPWWPTARIIRWGSFVPFYHWWYSL